VGVGLAVPEGVGVPVGAVPLVQVTELPSADRTHVICEPVLPVDVGDGVGLADPLPGLGGFGVVVIVVVVRGVGACTTAVPPVVRVVVTVRPPLVITEPPAPEGEVTLTVRCPAAAATAALTVFAIATAPAWASFAPA
jgi:hypothetical protein